MTRYIKVDGKLEKEEMLLARIKRPKKLRPTVEAIPFKYGLEVQGVPQEIIDLEDGKREDPEP